MAARIRAAERPALAGRLRRFAPAGGQALGATFACAIWAGLASPGLQLLPGQPTSRAARATSRRPRCSSPSR